MREVQRKRGVFRDQTNVSVVRDWNEAPQSPTEFGKPYPTIVILPENSARLEDDARVPITSRVGPACIILVAVVILGIGFGIRLSVVVATAVTIWGAISVVR